MKISVGRVTGKILLTAMLALLAAGAADARTTTKVIAKGQQLTDGKTAFAQVSAKQPHTLAARITVAPAQKVKISYSVVCSKGTQQNAEGYNPSTTPVTGVVTATAPLTKKLPLALASPTMCSISVYSQLMKKGKQTLEVLQG